MKKKDAIEFFGSVQQVAELLGISDKAVYGWPEKVPELRARQLSERSFGNLKFVQSDYSNALD